MNKPKIHVLIVEDDVVDRMACRRSFAQDTHDYEFVLYEAETARDGLQLARSEKLDCVLLDYNLPDMNGLEYLTELKNGTGEIKVPVIMLTGCRQRRGGGGGHQARCAGLCSQGPKPPIPGAAARGH